MKNLNELKRHVRALAKSLQVEVDWDRWEMEAPDCHRFAATSTHVVAFEPWSVKRPDGVEILGNEQIAQALEGAISDLRYGLEDCPPDCECREQADQP